MTATLVSNYSYDATLVRVVDGDTVILRVSKTFTMEVDFGFRIKEVVEARKSAELNFRLYGIDTPEIVGAEKVAGLQAKAELERLLFLGPIIAQTYKQDKFGRWLVTLLVTLPDNSVLNVNEELIKTGFATVYD